MAKTSFFKSCLGVFQGGGCRAAAFVGAYEEAVANGVSFVEVAGTSAGSIVASLIGAGATPKDLRDSVARIDFRSFLAAPDRRANRGITGTIVGRILEMKYPGGADLLFDQGLHSLQIKNWLDGQLAKLLPKEKHPLTFNSLPFPTYIVSTDLNRSEAKVWSQQTTPHELVSDAVHASCAIPIFFQPVNRRYVDGGVVSNLPTFVFFDREHSQRALASRVLAFVLKANEADPEDWGTMSFFRLLANAVVDGSQALQLNFQDDVHVVSIPTDDVRATDFEKMTQETVDILIENGAQATRTFLNQELLHVRSIGPGGSVCYGLDEVYTRVTESLELPLERIVVSDHNTDWVYKLFPSILCWRAKGVRVDVLVPELGDKASGAYRRRLLRAMGVNVTELKNETAVPVRAFVVIPRGDGAQLRAIVGVEEQSSAQTIAAVLYQGFLDEAAIEAVLAKLDELIAVDPAVSIPVPVFASDGHDLLLSRIRSVAQYSKPNIDIAIENIAVDHLVSLTHFVREYKYRQISYLIQLYRNLGIPLFDPASVLLSTKGSSIITPPVVEASGEQFVLIEGSTRATFCRDQGISHIKCVVVRGVNDPLPGKTIPFKRVRIVGRTLGPEDRYEGFTYDEFRHIERAVHPLNSLDPSGPAVE